MKKRWLTNHRGKSVGGIWLFFGHLKPSGKVKWSKLRMDDKSEKRGLVAGGR
jgi:hypothetical protein